jgi:hypothetical protein
MRNFGERRGEECAGSSTSPAWRDSQLQQICDVRELCDALFMDAPSSQNPEVAPDAPTETTVTTRCDRCGAANAVKVGARSLCESCYAEAGSCCLEFGADDLWDLDETKPV